jgi:hypothetical protein
MAGSTTSYAAAGAAVGTVVPGIGNAVGATVGAALGKLSEGYHQDNLFIKYRDNAMSALEGAGFPLKDWEADFGAFKLGHKDIPDRKIGANYAPEFKRLADFVTTYFNKKKPGLGDLFQVYNQQFAAALPKDEQYKGNPAEAIKKAVANYMNLSEIMNQTDGLGVGQPYVDTSTGQVVVPSTQQGEGIFSQLNNYASAQLNKIGGQVVSTVAANISGQQQIAAGGGVTLTGGATIGNPVTKNTTANNSTASGSSNVLIIVLVVVVLAFTGVFKKIFK